MKSIYFLALVAILVLSGCETHKARRHTLECFGYKDLVEGDNKNVISGEKNGQRFDITFGSDTVNIYRIQPVSN